MKSRRWPHAGLLAIALLLGASLAYAQGTQLLVSNVQVQQRQFTAVFDVTYDLETVGDLPVWVSLFLSTDGGASYPNICATVTGDVGAGVLPGSGKHIVWDAGADFPGFSSATCRLRVTVHDDASLDGFVYVGPGTFTMGSPTTEVGHDTYGDETQHQVTLTHGIYVQTTEVTNQQYMEMAQWAYDNGYATATSASLNDNLDGSTQLLKTLGTGHYEMTFNAGVFSCINPTHPVKDVSWYGSVAYCDWLSLQQGLPRAYSHSTWECNSGSPYTATGYRLPTEAEWEYACRAGTQTPFHTGSCLDAGTEANYRGSYPYTGCPTGPFVGWTVPVGSYPANAFGLYDMHGNLLEWCNDWLDIYDGTVTDPVGPGAGSSRVLRGGGWSGDAQYCRSAIRSSGSPGGSILFIGFRPVRSADAVNLAVFAYVAPGTFMMGSPTTELSRYADETQHQVTLTHGIYVQTTEVTNQQYMEMAQWAYDNGYATATSTYLYDNLDGSTQILKTLGAEYDEMTFNAGVFSCLNPTHPVKYVSWYGSVAYCDWLSLQQGLLRAYSHSTWECNSGNPYTAAGYRLPTEAEWEYACRAGTQTPFSTGSCLDAGTEANYAGYLPYTGCPTGPFVGWTVPVGSYPANAFGLYDMHGNEWEWCNDWYGDYDGTVTDPVGPGAGSGRVVRGGVYSAYAHYCRSAYRNSFDAPYVTWYYIGFRPVRSAP
jgi:formylglycine-generating enzyme required for sulfatase activity